MISNDKIMSYFLITLLVIIVFIVGTCIFEHPKRYEVFKINKTLYLDLFDKNLHDSFVSNANFYLENVDNTQNDTIKWYSFKSKFEIVILRLGEIQKFNEIPYFINYNAISDNKVMSSYAFLEFSNMKYSKYSLSDLDEFPNFTLTNRKSVLFKTNGKNYFYCKFFDDKFGLMSDNNNFIFFNTKYEKKIFDFMIFKNGHNTFVILMYPSPSGQQLNSNDKNLKLIDILSQNQF